jgi:hypothetical protein
MARRFLTISGLALAVVMAIQLKRGGPVASRTAPAAPIAPVAAGDGDEIDEGRNLDAAIEDRRHAARFIRQALLDLERGACSLAAAADRVFYFSLHNHPRHLEYVAAYEDGKTIRLQVAQNLLREFRDRRSDGAALEAVLTRLEHEYQLLAGAEDGGATPEVH